MLIYTDEEAVERMLQVIHELEPSGVGAVICRRFDVTTKKHKLQQSQ
jgi:RNA polymerase sigma-54 factor